ncbi:MFS transporter [Kitasatospora xanthocidica]|uniref:MFS transporter n=1 Tax=Kitasatospora xanthocidica TaxID=83382 RepID=UPI0036F105D8
MSRHITRDSVTWMLYLQLSAFGFFLYGFGPSVPLLARDLGVSDAQASLSGTALAVGMLLAGLGGARLSRRLTRGTLQWLALSLLGAGAAVYCAGRGVEVACAGALIAGFAGTVVINTTTAALAEHHGEHAASAISEANGISVAIGLAAPALLGGLRLLGLDWRWGLLLLLPFIAVLRFAFRRVRLRDTRDTTAVSAGRLSPLPRDYWRAWAVLLACATVEMCMSFWASEELRSHTGLAAGTATMAITLMLFGMVVGRLGGARLARAVPAGTLLLASLSLNAVAFTLLWLSTGPALALTGMVLCGLGMALQFPLTVTSAVHASAGRPDQAMARVSVGESLATGLGPLALGLLSGAIGIHRAFLLVPLLLTIAGLGVAVHRTAEPVANS